MTQQNWSQVMLQTPALPELVSSVFLKGAA